MRWSIGAIAGVLAAASVQAQGISVYTHSACALARGGTGVADPCRDGSSIFYNPAALAMQPGVASMGTLALFTNAEFTFDSTRATFESTQPVKAAPHAWIAARAGHIGAGLGFWAPYGLATKWPLSFEGRFVGYDNLLRAIYIQPTVAVQVIRDRLSLGAGLDVVRGTVKIRRRVDLATVNIPGTMTPFSAIGVPLGTDFADVKLDVDAWAATFSAGVHYRISDRWSAGARYLHKADLDLDGTADFRLVLTGIILGPGNPLGLPPGTPLDAVLATQFADAGPLSDQALTTAITLPNQVVAGVRYQLRRNVRLFFDYQWMGWRQFDIAVLAFQRAPTDTLFLNFRNTSTFRLGGDYEPTARWAVRVGILYNNAATPISSVTPLLQEARRFTVAAGAGYRITRRFCVDAGGEMVFQEDRSGSVRPRRTRSQASPVVGLYETSAHVLALTLVYRLGDVRALLHRPARKDSPPHLEGARCN